MEQRRAPFYLRRTKEAMVYFPERQPDGSWTARKIFTKRIPHTVAFSIDGDEFQLYRHVTSFVKEQSHKAAARGDDPRARAVGFLMALYQRRLASSTYAMRRSLENRAQRLRDGLRRADELLRKAPPELPDAEEFEEMEESERERLEELLEAMTLAGNRAEVEEEIGRLKELAEQATHVLEAAREAKLASLKVILKEQHFFDNPDQRLLIFTEFKDTLDYLAGNKAQGLPGRLVEWGFRVGVIHGSMKAGSRDEPGTRLHAEQQFKDGAIQILVATEASGEGINLQSCHILFNYDIPWNPNRLEQRMGRIHRYGQTHDCRIFNFVATNTIEGRVLQTLLEKLTEIRDALDDDAVFNVVGEVLPAAQIERILRAYYAGELGQEDMEDRLLRDVKEEHFRAICQNALEGLATKKLNLAMLVERRARAQERRVVPETIARFLREAAGHVPLAMKPVPVLAHAFDPGPTPVKLRQYESAPGWKLDSLANRYPRLSTDRTTAEQQRLEWVTPGHPLFEALRRYAWDGAGESLAQGACFYSVEHDAPTRLDYYRARVVDGLGQVLHERLFAVEVTESRGTSANSVEPPRRREPSVLGDFVPGKLPSVAALPDTADWLTQEVLTPFLNEVRQDRVAEIERIASHVELSLTELLQREDRLIGRFVEEAERGVEGAAGLLKQSEDRHAALMVRRERRRQEFERQRSLTLQSVERMTSVLILPHPERERPKVRRLRPDAETEAIAMRVAYVVTHCDTEPRLQIVKDPASLSWHEVKKIDHYWVSVDAVREPMKVRENGA